MDLYSTTSLTGVIANLILPPNFFLDTFFGNVVSFDTQDVKVDVDKGKRRIAPLVSPLVAGKIVKGRGITTQTIAPAYVKDKRVFDPAKPFKRAVGETIGGELTPQQRIQLALAIELKDQVEMLQRRQEVMAAEALRTGHIVLSGEEYPTVDVDFQRDAALTVALSGAARWNQAGTYPLKDIDGWTLLVLKKSGANVTDIVLDPDAWDAFENNASVKEHIARLNSAGVKPFDNAKQTAPGVRFMGTLKGYNFWVYADWYINDAGTEVPILPSGTVILGGQRIEGTRYYGAIKDEEALSNGGLVALPYYPKSWVEKDPANRLLLLQSAPLVAPHRPDASFCATVL